MSAEPTGPPPLPTPRECNVCDALVYNVHARWRSGTGRTFPLHGVLVLDVTETAVNGTVVRDSRGTWTIVRPSIAQRATCRWQIHRHQPVPLRTPDAPDVPDVTAPRRSAS